MAKVITRSTPLESLAPEWDLLEPTRKLINDKKIKCEHIKGHQDDVKEEEELRKT